MTTYTISGYLVGPIWMSNAECFKEISYRFTRGDDGRRDVHETLRNALLAVTNDGDFRACALSHGVLTVRKQQRHGNTIKTVERVFPLDNAKSISDMVRADWEGPFDAEVEAHYEITGE